jgi:hypothetical protein
MYVADRDGEIVAFAGAITRGSITFLTDLFVRPDQQSSHLGKALLERALPRQDAHIRFTVSSTDPRALALYVRAGMRPCWPHVNLRLAAPLRLPLPAQDVEIVVGAVDDPELVRWDARIGGRSRPVDHAHWVDAQQATPLWFRRRGAAVGYGYVRPGAGTLLDPAACWVGPLSAVTSEDAVACALAAVVWARARAEVVRIDVPGPHPALAPLLDAGCRITYVETFVSSASQPFFDAQRYIPSGSTLF